MDGDKHHAQHNEDRNEALCAASAQAVPGKRCCSKTGRDTTVVRKRHSPESVLCILINSLLVLEVNNRTV